MSALRTSSALVIGTVAVFSLSTSPRAPRAATVAAKAPADRSLEWPVRFEPNRGQSTRPAAFLSDTHGHRWRFRERSVEIESRGLPNPDAIEMTWVGSSPDGLEPLETLPSQSHYFFGRDPKGWQQGVPNFARLRYESVYDGIDVVFYGRGGHLEHDFVVAPLADPAKIRVRFVGARDVRLVADGGLRLRSKDGASLELGRPMAYQERGAEKTFVSAGYRVDERSREVTFELGAYDRSRPLVIDPTVMFSTYVGGPGTDSAADVAVDAAGNVYIAGQTTRSEEDAFVAKFDSQGRLLYRTQFGGGGVTCNNRYPSCPFNPPTSSGDDGDTIGIQRHDYDFWAHGEDSASALAIDAGGNVYVVGQTSPYVDFPVTADAYQATLGSRPDAFLAKLDATGALVYGSYLGGTGSDLASDVQLGAAGDVYVVGTTGSTDFPTANALQPALAGESDVFVSRFDRSLGRLTFSTYVGGSAADSASAAVLDVTGRLHVAGSTSSGDFPTSGGAYQTTLNGSSDGFVAAVAANGGMLSYSTYLGGGAWEGVGDAAVGPDGSLYLTGSTGSRDFPVTSQRWPFAHSDRYGFGDGFLARLSADGSALLRAMFLGARGGSGVALDTSGDVYISGGGLVLKLDAEQWADVFHVDAPADAAQLALGPGEDIYVAGHTSSLIFPTIAAQQSRGSTLDGGVDARGRPGPEAFLVRISQQAGPSPAFEEDHPSVEYEGTWTDHSSAGHSGGRARRTSHPAALARISFDGTGIQVYGYRDSASGFARIELDNRLLHAGAADLFAHAPDHRVLLASITGLARGPHRLVVRPADGQRNILSSGGSIAFDGFTVIGGSTIAPLGPPPVPAPAPGETLRLEETDPALVYGGGWDDVGSYALTESGGTVEFTFEGEGLAFIEPDPNFHIRQYARLVIDGEMFCCGNTAFVPRGRHKATIVQESEGWWVDRWARGHLGIDAFDVYGSAPTPTPSPTPVATPYGVALVAPRDTIAVYNPTFRWELGVIAPDRMPSEFDFLLQSSSGTELARSTHAFADICRSYWCTMPSPVTLTNGSYQWSITTRNAVGDGPTTTAAFTVARDVPAAPVLGEPSATNLSLPTYNWAVSAGANEYVIEVSGPSGTLVSDRLDAATACNSTTCSHRPDALLEEGTYTWRVQAANEFGASPWASKSLSVFFKPPQEAPRALSPSGVVDTPEPTYRWTAVPKATSYQVNGMDVTSQCAGGVCSWTSWWLSPGTYNWTARGKNPAGVGPVSNSLTFTVPFGARVENDNTRVAYVGSWQTETSAPGDFSMQTAARSDETGASVQLTFEGIGVRWFGAYDPAGGIARVYIDDVLRATVDTYKSTRSYWPRLFSTADLTHGTHTIRIQVTGTKNPASTGTSVWLDYFETLTAQPATPTPTPRPTPRPTAPPTTVRVESTDARVALAGTWFLRTSTNHSGGSAHLATDAGSTASLPFDGTGVAWIGHRDMWSGIAKVYIDNTLRATVDTYSATDQHRVVMYQANDLAPGAHTIRVEVTNTRTINAKAAWVWVDAFDVMSGGGGTPTATPTPTPPPTATPTPTPTSMTPPTATPTPSSGTIRVENTDARVVLAGKWFLNTSAGANHSGGSASLAMDTGSTATLTFDGTGIRWIGLKDPWAGIAKVYVDGALQATVDTYSASTERRATLFSADLAAGSHTIRVEVTGTRATASGGAWIWVDAFDVVNGSAPPAPTPTPTTGMPSPTPTPTMGTPPPPTPTPTPSSGFVRFEQTSDRVTTTGTWFTKTNTAHSGGSAVMSMEPGDRATFSFSGTAVRWIGLRDPWSGIARVYIDDVLRGTVDAYSATQQRQALLFEASGLAAGNHVLRVEVTSTRNAASGGAWIWVDAFEMSP